MLTRRVRSVSSEFVSLVLLAAWLVAAAILVWQLSQGYPQQP